MLWYPSLPQFWVDWLALLYKHTRTDMTIFEYQCMTATLTFLRKFICCCLGSGSDQSNTVLSHNRVNCSSCFGHIDEEEDDGHGGGEQKRLRM